MEPKIMKHHHHILPTRVALAVGVSLLILTIITVWVAGFDLGNLNFLIAMLVASSKASLVALFFMNLKYDRKENGVIFITSFIFLAIFIVLTGTDLFFRGDVAVKGPLTAAPSKSKFKKPWVATPELVAHGKELFAVQCTSCHGEKGHGDGPAAGALSPHPRNFTSTDGWKNGRKPTQVFDTLNKGVAGSAMASYATLPPDDRWALAHYVLTLGPPPPQDTPADFAKAGIDPTKESATTVEAPTIPIEFAIERMAVAETKPEEQPLARSDRFQRTFPSNLSVGAAIYQNQCAKCHNERGEGGIKVKNMGTTPIAFVTTASFRARPDSLRSAERFSDVVARGLPGDLMPGHSELTKSELQELYQFVRFLAGI